MPLLDADITRATALVIDANAASRSSLASMLRDCGVAHITQASRPQDARRLIENGKFDIILCEYHFPDEPVSGQDIMDDLRLSRSIPLSTVVVMISSEAGYAKVSEAAEAALDAYLVKPHTEAALRQRVGEARQRKRALKDIITKVEQGEFAEAAELCQARFDARAPAWMPAARIGAELWLRLGNARAAQVLFDAILLLGAVPWARLGLARAQYEGGSVVQARRSLESLLNEQPGYADAYDVLGRVLLDQGEPAKALDALRQASQLTPGSIARLVKHGLLAFYYGDPKEAAEVLGKAARLGLNSRIFDLQGLVLLASLQYDTADRRGLAQSLASMSSAFKAAPASARLRRFESVIRIFKCLQERRSADALKDVGGLLAELNEPDFEFEAACNVLSVMSRLDAGELAPHRDDVGTLAGRFAVSRVTSELLVKAGARQPSFEPVIQDRYADVCTHAENAVSHTVGGSPTQAVTLLLSQAEVTYNAKLIDLAMHTLQRHKDRITDAEALMSRVQALHERYRSYGTQVHMSKVDDPRSLSAATKPT